MAKEKQEEQPKPQRQELTPDLAKACMEFLGRADIKGAEAQTMYSLQAVISGYIE